MDFYLQNTIVQNYKITKHKLTLIIYGVKILCKIVTYLKKNKRNKDN